jgi:hypothetical protein
MIAVLAFLNQFFDLLLGPLRSLEPLYGVLILSSLTSILMLLVFRTASNQKAIKKAKDQIQAHLLAVRLYQDQLGVVLRANLRILRGTLVYLRLSLKPLAVMFLPLLVLLVQLEMRLGRVPLEPQESFLLSARLAEPAFLDQASLELPAGLELAAPPLRIPSENEVDWKLRAESYGEYDVRVAVAGQDFTKRVTVGEGVVRLSTTRLRGSLFAVLLHPGEPPFPADSPVEEVRVNYRPRAINFIFFQAHWLVPFFVLTLVFGFLLKGIMRTEI